MTDMSIKIRSISAAPDQSLIAGVEEKLGVVLPSDYLKFLASYNGGEPETNVFKVPGENIDSGVNEFIALADLPKEYELAGFEEIGGAIPIAVAEGGNYVCLAVAGPDLGAVLFWDHETTTTREEMTRLANSLQEFLELLQPFDPIQIRLKPGQVKSAWIDPSLLEDSE